MAILEVRNIEKHFGRTNVLKDVSFSMVTRPDVLQRRL